MDIFLLILFHLFIILVCFGLNIKDPASDEPEPKYFTNEFMYRALLGYIFFILLGEAGRSSSDYFISNPIFWGEELGRAIGGIVLALLSAALICKLFGFKIRVQNIDNDKKNSHKDKRDKNIFKEMTEDIQDHWSRKILLVVYPFMFIGGLIEVSSEGVKEPLKFTFNAIFDGGQTTFAFIMFVVAVLWTLILNSQKQVKPLKNDKHNKIDEDKEAISKDEIDIELERIELLFKRKVISEDERNLMRKKVLGI